MGNPDYSGVSKLSCRCRAKLCQFEVAVDTLTPQSTITNWVRRSRAGSLGEVQVPAAVARRPVSELEAEVSRLRRELASAKLDNEILRKATVYFAKESR